MSATNTPKQRSLPILFLGDGRIEWVGTDPETRHQSHCRMVETHSAQELAKIANSVVQRAGDRPGRCMVMLGGDLTSQRVLTLGALPPKDLRTVLQRKAANLLGVEPRDAWYQATQLAGNDGQKEERWLLCAVRRSELLALDLELTRVGFRPRRIMSPRLAMLSATLPGSTESVDELTRILLSVEPSGVSIALSSKGDLVQQTFVPGRFEGQSGLAASVLQELRSFEGFWRKLSRGGSVDEVLLFGLTEDTSMALTPAIQTVLGNRDCTVHTGPLCESESEARAFALSMAAISSDPRGDLTPKRPPSNQAILTAGMCAATVGILLGFWGRGMLASHEQAKQVEASRLTLESRDHDALRRRIDLSEETLASIAVRASRLQAVGDAGYSMASLLSAVETAFEGRAKLESIKLDPVGNDVALQLQGSTDPDPARSLANLSQLVAELKRSPICHDIKLLPPSGSVDSVGNSDLRFRILGQVEVAQ